MKYIGTPNYDHSSHESLGILLINLGTPDAPTTSAVRRYLAEFLSDPRVIEIPTLIWQCILHGVILRIRPSRLAQAYMKIWDKGSPLLNISKQQLVGVEQQLQTIIKGTTHIDLAMRYGNPKLSSVLSEFRQKNVRRLLILPMYPQYSATTTAATFDAIANVLKKWRWLPEIRMINHYHDHPAYISALKNSIKHYWQTHSQPEKLLFSFHGLPKHYVLAGDPYHCECYKTARLVATELQLKEDQWQLCFQSRFGPREWLKPYTDVTLKTWAAQGIKSVHVICPGFSADCLETLEEINIQNREFFLSSGGQTFHYIPALNDHADHIKMIAALILSHTQGWIETSSNWNKADIEIDLKNRVARSEQLKSLL